MIYCPECGRGYTEKVDRIKQLKEILGKDTNIDLEIARVYKCNDCGYEFIGGIKHKK